MSDPIAIGDAPARSRRRLAALASALAFSGAGWAAWAGYGLLPLALLLTAFSTGAALLRWRGTKNRPAAAASALREQVAEIGGGFYGAAGFATWVYLEAGALAAAWRGSVGIAGFVADRAMERLTGLGVESALAFARAAAWPVTWIGEMGPLPAAALGAAGLLVYRGARRLVDVPKPNPAAAHGDTT